MVPARASRSSQERSRLGRRRAVTLIEMVVALALTTIVVAAATSVMVVASRAMPKPTDSVVRATSATMALAIFESEAQTALEVGVAGGQLALRVPDRTGDSIPELITYDWGGTAGNPLTRDDGTEQTLIANVQSVSFQWTMARGSATRVGTIFITITLDRGLVLRSTVRLPSEPEASL